MLAQPLEWELPDEPEEEVKVETEAENAQEEKPIEVRFEDTDEPVESEDAVEKKTHTAGDASDSKNPRTRQPITTSLANNTSHTGRHEGINNLGNSGVRGRTNGINQGGKRKSRSPLDNRFVVILLFNPQGWTYSRTSLTKCIADLKNSAFAIQQLSLFHNLPITHCRLNLLLLHRQHNTSTRAVHRIQWSIAAVDTNRNVLTHMREEVPVRSDISWWIHKVNREVVIGAGGTENSRAFRILR